MEPANEIPNEMLASWFAGHQPSLQDRARLLAWESRDRDRLAALEIPPENLEDAFERRSHWFASVVSQGLPLPAIGDRLPETLWGFWLPFALQIADRRSRLSRPFVQGISGVQGTGKTTLAAALAIVLEAMGYRTLCVSIDDLYKTYRDRQRLQQEDPQLIWRGPPGTHDVALGIDLLDRLRAAGPEAAIAVPRFDKACHGGEGDRAASQQVRGIDIVLFEGWFVGARPLDVLPDRWPDPIRSPADVALAAYANAALPAYQPLWERLDRLLLMYPRDYRRAIGWRQQAERNLRAAGRGGMTDTEVEAFVRYFWKALHPELYLEPLRSGDRPADLVVEVAGDRQLAKVYPGIRTLPNA